MAIKEMLDVNKDGKVNFEDFTCAIKNTLDLDKDGKVELSEIIKVVKEIVLAL